MGLGFKGFRVEGLGCKGLGFKGLGFRSFKAPAQVQQRFRPAANQGPMSARVGRPTGEAGIVSNIIVLDSF